MELRKHPVNERFIRLYFQQLINDEFVFCEHVKTEAEVRFGPLNTEILEQISFEQIGDLLSNYYTEELFLFATEEELQWLNSFGLHQIIDNPGLQIPRLFTGIKQYSEDEGGLFVLECYNVQLLELYTSSGRALIDTCSDLELGVSGSVYYRLNSSVFWEMGKVHLDFESSILNDDFDYHSFPFIHDRDLALLDDNLAEIIEDENMLRPEIFERILSENPKLTRSLSPLFERNKELAKIAVLQNPRMFSILDMSIQHDHRFVVSLLAESDQPKIIFTYLSERLKADNTVRKLLKLPDSEKNEEPEDDLPF